MQREYRIRIGNSYNNNYILIIRMHKRLNWFGGVKPTLIICCCLLTACVSTMQKGRIDAFNSLYDSGQYDAAAQGELARIGDKTDDPSMLLEHLQAGAALRYSRNYDQSNEVFDRCESFIKSYNEDVINGTAKNVTAVLVSDAATDYRAREYDGIMVNTYKAINYWQQGKTAEARVEFNRAVERQRRAKERFAKEISKQKEAIAEKQKEENAKAQGGNLDFNKSLDNPEVDNIIKQHYSNLSEFKKYPDFVNPFTTYMAGLFFMSEGDYSKAVDLLKESYGMVDTNSVLKSDLFDCDRMSSGQSVSKNQVWVVFENGLGPVKEEFRVDLPIFLVSDSVYYTGFALPKLVMRPSAYNYLDARKDGQQLARTEVVASMDRVIQTEFEKRYPMVVARAMVSAIIKTYLQHEAKKQNEWVGLIAAVYQGVTTEADLRMWTALPKDFQIAKFETPKDGLFQITAPNGMSMDFEVKPQANSVIYIKATTPGVPMEYTVIEL